MDVKAENRARRLVEILTQVAPDLQYKTLVDLGCGNGRHIKPMQKYFDVVIGVDRDSHDESIVRADFTKCIDDIKQHTVDVVVMNNSWHYAPHEDTVNEILRLLKPDGVCCINEPGQNSHFAAEFTEEQFRSKVRKLEEGRKKLLKLVKHRIIYDDMSTNGTGYLTIFSG